MSAADKHSLTPELVERVLAWADASTRQTPPMRALVCVFERMATHARTMRAYSNEHDQAEALAHESAARGCLLALVRLAHGCESLHCGHVGGWGEDWNTWDVRHPPGLGPGCAFVGHGDTEFEALVDALELTLP